MVEIPAIFCDIDGVVTEKFAIPDYDRFGEPRENMIRILNVLGKEFVLVFITGRWAMGQDKVERFLNTILPNVNKLVYCKEHDYPGTTAEYKIEKVKELEGRGYRFLIGLDDHSVVTGFLHNHGIFTARVLSD